MMLHPATVHFAIVLPVVASVFGIIYIFTRTEGMSKISSRLTVITALAMIAVWYTGDNAGPQIYDFLSAKGKEELLEHKELGLYLAIAMGIIAALKIFGCKMKNFTIELVSIILLIATTFTTLAQGKMGGELVYNYGMPFKSDAIEKKLKKAYANAEATEEDDEKVEFYEDAIDEIETLSQKVNKVYGIEEKIEEEEE